MKKCFLKKCYNSTYDIGRNYLNSSNVLVFKVKRVNYYYYLNLMALGFCQISASEGDQSQMYPFMVDDLTTYYEILGSAEQDDLEPVGTVGIEPRQIFAVSVTQQSEGPYYDDLRQYCTRSRAKTRISIAELLNPMERSVTQKKVHAGPAFRCITQQRITRGKTSFLTEVYTLDCSKLDMKKCLRYYEEAASRVQGPLCEDPNQPAHYLPAIINLKLVIAEGGVPTAAELALKNCYHRLQTRKKRLYKNR